ncbi:ComF family protein [Flavobacterium sp. SM15]|uniref:ComF family protein n=1 Tax=Flavobacterium sp. SM15 TaxID=2908005 RepID=UPI001ED9E405|nr:phosphoribosyltransferase family protein [Flavobacterium sp. SM15]MCG2610214.1 ComF family protein [Flavobacterium sp. SM15]
MNTLKNLMNVFFPRSCKGCLTLLLLNEKTICSNCRHELPLTNHYRNPENETFKRFYGRLPLQHASSIVYFHKKGIAQQLIHQLKYKGAQEVGTFFGTYYSEFLLEVPSLNDVSEIIPVPLHPKKTRERGYNQVTEFGKTLASGLNIPYNDTLLHRNFYSNTQTKKNILGRTELTSELFGIKYSEKDYGKHFLLIDDVITTGSTLEACAKTLLKIPKVKISIVTIAYAQ